MKLNKQTIIRALCAHTLICSILAAVFSQKKKTLSSIFAGLSIAGALANLVIVFSDKCPICTKKLATADVCEESDCECDDEECIEDGDIYCNFEDAVDENGEEADSVVPEDAE